MEKVGRVLGELQAQKEQIKGQEKTLALISTRVEATIANESTQT